MKPKAILFSIERTKDGYYLAWIESYGITYRLKFMGYTKKQIVKAIRRKYRLSDWQYTGWK